VSIFELSNSIFAVFLYGNPTEVEKKKDALDLFFAETLKVVNS